MNQRQQPPNDNSLKRLARKTYYRYGHESIFEWLERTIKFGVGKILGQKRSFHLSQKALQQWMERESDLEDVLNTVYQFKGYGEFMTIRPRQIYDEIYDLARIVQNHDPDTVLEIGTDKGGTFYIWCRILDASDIISIDLPEDGSKFTRQQFLNDIRSPAELHFIRQDAHSKETVELVRDSLDGNSLDFLFLDCDFRYEFIKQDFEYYRPLMAEDGVIAIHDIANAEGGVINFWEEIKSTYETQELIATPPRRPYELGIGVIYL